MSVYLTYSHKFRVDAVALAAASGRSLPAAAAHFGIPLTEPRLLEQLAWETDSESGANSDAAVDPLMLKPMEDRLGELDRENNLLRKILVSRQIPAEDDSGSLAQANADVPMACVVPVAPAEECEDVAFTHAMSRVRAVLESLEKAVET